MKKYPFLLVLLFCVQIYAQRKPKIKGNKNVIEVIKALPPFSAIELKDDLDIFIQNSSQEGYVLNADDNLIDVLKFKVVDGTLYISAFYKIIRKKKLEITINYQELDAITVHEGRIRMNDVVNSEELDVHTFESAKLDLNANAAIVHLTMEGNSSGNFSIDADSLNVNLKDKVDLQLYATSETIHMNMSTSASSKMDGTAHTLNIALSGNANLKAMKLQTSEVVLNLVESSSARVNASELITISSSGSSKTYVYGDGKIILEKFLDSSELYKREKE